MKKENFKPATTPKLKGENLAESSEWMSMNITNAEFQQCWREAIRKANEDRRKQREAREDGS